MGKEVKGKSALIKVRFELPLRNFTTAKVHKQYSTRNSARVAGGEK